MKKVTIEKVGVVFPKYRVRVIKDGALVYQYFFDTKEEAEEAKKEVKK